MGGTQQQLLLAAAKSSPGSANWVINGMPLFIQEPDAIWVVHIVQDNGF